MSDPTGNTWDHRIVPVNPRATAKKCYANCGRRVTWAGIYKTERRGRVVELMRHMCREHARKWREKYDAQGGP